MEIPKLNRLAMVLKEKGRSRKWLAEKLGVHANTISKWCQNKQQPHIEIFYQISVFLDCDLPELFRSTKSNSSSEKKNKQQF